MNEMINHKGISGICSYNNLQSKFSCTIGFGREDEIICLDDSVEGLKKAFIIQVDLLEKQNHKLFEILKKEELEEVSLNINSLPEGITLVNTLAETGYTLGQAIRKFLNA